MSDNQKMGVQMSNNMPSNTHNETNPKMEKAENPCPARIIGKRKSSIVSDTLVSKLSNLFGGGEGNRTPVRKLILTTFSECRRSIKFPFYARRTSGLHNRYPLIRDRLRGARRFTFTVSRRPNPEPRYSRAGRLP